MGLAEPAARESRDRVVDGHDRVSVTIEGDQTEVDS